MSPTLALALKKYRLARTPGSFEPVFAHVDGRLLEPGDLVKREFHPALWRTGLRRITFHSLRHSFTTLLLAQGESIKYIQSKLVHASVQITLDRYGHLLPATHKGAAKRLDVTLFGNSVSKPLANSSEVGVTHNGESPEVLELAGLS